MEVLKGERDGTGRGGGGGAEGGMTTARGGLALSPRSPAGVEGTSLARAGWGVGEPPVAVGSSADDPEDGAVSVGVGAAGGSSLFILAASSAPSTSSVVEVVEAGSLSPRVMKRSLLLRLQKKAMSQVNALAR